MGRIHHLWTLLSRGRYGRRSFERRAVVTAGELLMGGGTVSCLIRDISASGAFLSLKEVPPLGALGELAIPGAGLRAAIRVVRRTGDGCAVAFQCDEVGAVMAGWVRGLGGQTNPQ